MTVEREKAPRAGKREGAKSGGARKNEDPKLAADADPNNPAFAEALRPYLEHGWDLIPLHKPDAVTLLKDGKERKDGKRPLHKNWTVRSYGARRVARVCAEQRRNIGVRLRADQLVIDVDPRNGGELGFKRLCRDVGLNPDAWPRVQTGSGGSHFYMTKPADVAVVDSLEEYPGVEFKSKGRQVVAAHSIHPDTRREYEWDFLHPPLAEATAAPDALLDLIRRPERAAAEGGGEHTPEEVAAMLDALDPTDFREHGRWLTLMMACHHASGGDARDEFLSWSASDPEFADREEENGRRWDSLHADRDASVTHKTLHKFLRDAGREGAIPRPSAEEDFADEGDGGTANTEGVASVTGRSLAVNRNSTAADTYGNSLSAVFRSELDPAWDELKRKVVFRTPMLPWDESYGRELDDHVVRMVRLYLTDRHQGVDFQPGKDNVIEALMTLAYGNKFNPVVDYLEGLRWDGVQRVDGLFARYFNCGDDAYTRAASRCFMVGAVRRARKPGSKFDTMPVLRGPQGWNKSTGVKALFGADWFSDADLGNLRSKDAAMLLRGIWVQEFAEIDSLNRTETGTLKAFCSRAVDRLRDPYERITSDVPRRCVFVGTVNEGGYLKDTTGGRRFWPLTVNAPIDPAMVERDRDQLWAEAAALESSGEPDVLPTHLWPAAAERQADEATPDPWADVLSNFLDDRAFAHAIDDREFGSAPPPPDRVHTAELRAALGIDAPKATKGNDQRIRAVMENVLGWRSRRGVRVGGRVGAGYVLGADGAPNEC